MNETYLHLLVYQAPVFAVFFGIVLLGYGLPFKNVSITKAGLASVLAGALLASLLYYANVWTPSHSNAAPLGLIVGHSISGTGLLWSVGLLGLLALVGLLTTSSRPARARKPKIWATVTLVVSVGLLGLFLWLGLYSASSEATLQQEVASESSADTLQNR